VIAESIRKGSTTGKSVLTHNEEKYGENAEAHQLDGLASPEIDEKEGYPIARDETTDGKDDVANGNVMKRLIHAKRARLG